MANGIMEAYFGSSLSVFLGFTVVIVGGAALLAGRVQADEWRPAWHVVSACAGLTLANRFLVYALFEGQLVHVMGLASTFVVITAIGIAAWRLTQVRKMVVQYPWVFERTSLWSYRTKGGVSD
jgi:branched-chain amino acid transport system ATP-binding protein